MRVASYLTPLLIKQAVYSSKRQAKNNPISLGSECLPLSFSSLSLLQTQIVVILVHENAVRAKREWIRIAFNAINECGQHEGRPVMVVVVM